jgi:hypothetical protein
MAASIESSMSHSMENDQIQNSRVGVKCKSDWMSSVSIVLFVPTAILWFGLMMFSELAPRLAGAAHLNIIFIFAAIAAIALPIEGIVWGACAFLAGARPRSRAFIGLALNLIPVLFLIVRMLSSPTR